jgi:small subunit ribosomal protein S11
MATKKVTAKAKKKVGATVTDHGRVYITATFNNTLVTVTNDKGDTLGWSSSGSRGFKGTRKSTPYAASVAVEEVVKRIVSKGMKSVDVFVKGPGSGRDSSLRGIKSAGPVITSISDITPMPHNGPRSKKKRRV